jgi:hypothetical protein
VWSPNRIARDMTRAMSEIHIMAAPTDRRGGGVCRMCSDIGKSATKKNPGQSTLPGLLQVVASACRLFCSGGGCRGMGAARTGLTHKNMRSLDTGRLVESAHRDCPATGTPTLFCSSEIITVLGSALGAGAGPVARQGASGGRRLPDYYANGQGIIPFLINDLASRQRVCETRLVA